MSSTPALYHRKPIPHAEAPMTRTTATALLALSLLSGWLLGPLNILPWAVALGLLAPLRWVDRYRLGNTDLTIPALEPSRVVVYASMALAGAHMAGLGVLGALPAVFFLAHLIRPHHVLLPSSTLHKALLRTPHTWLALAWGPAALVLLASTPLGQGAFLQYVILPVVGLFVFLSLPGVVGLWRAQKAEKGSGTYGQDPTAP